MKDDPSECISSLGPDIEDSREEQSPSREKEPDYWVMQFWEVSLNSIDEALNPITDDENGNMPSVANQIKTMNAQSRYERENNWKDLMDYDSDASQVSFHSEVSMSARSGYFESSFMSDSSGHDRNSSTDDMSRTDRSRGMNQIFDPSMNMMSSYGKFEDIQMELQRHGSNRPPKPNNEKQKNCKKRISHLTWKLNHAKDKVFEEKVKVKKLDKRIQHLIEKAKQYE